MSGMTHTIKDWFLCHLVLFQVLILMVIGVCVFYPLENTTDFQSEETVQLSNTIIDQNPLPNKPVAVFKKMDETVVSIVKLMPLPIKKAKDATVSETKVSFNPKIELKNTELSPQELRLQEARKAYWLKDIRRSIKAYHQYIGFYPLQDSAYVELENVYRSVGQQTQMIPVYKEAIVLFQEADQLEKSLKLQALLNAL